MIHMVGARVSCDSEWRECDWLIQRGGMLLGDSEGEGVLLG